MKSGRKNMLMVVVVVRGNGNGVGDIVCVWQGNALDQEARGKEQHEDLDVQ